MNPENQPALARPARTALLAVTLALGVWLRVRELGQVALFGDEYHKHAIGEVAVSKILTSFDLVGSHVLVPLLQHASLALFGPGVVSFRLVALVPGILTLLLFYPFVRTLLGGERDTASPALVATLALAIHPMHVYYTRFGRAYAFLLLLELLLVWALAAAFRARDGRGRTRTWVAIGLAAALLPLVHLTSASVVAALALAAVTLAWRDGGARAALVPAGVFLVAGLVSFACYLPVLDDVRAYFAQTKDVKDQPSTVRGILLLLAGGTGLAATLPVLLALAAVYLARLRSRVGLLVAAALLGPLIALLATRPHGMEYAWARYLLIWVPLVPVLGAWALFHGLGRWGGLPAQRLGLLVACLGLVATFWLGPLRAPRGPAAFSNSYLALRDLPPFDVPWAGASELYRRIASEPGDGAVVEFPVPITRAVLLERNLGIVHGRPVLVGWPGKLPAALAGDAPYVDVLALERGDADWLVVHRDLPREVRAYWKSVYGDSLRGSASGWDVGLLLRHEATFIGSQAHVQPPFVEDRVQAIIRRLGPPVYADDLVLGWKLSD